jgi:hypothetical protein
MCVCAWCEASKGGVGENSNAAAAPRRGSPPPSLAHPPLPPPPPPPPAGRAHACGDVGSAPSPSSPPPELVLHSIAEGSWPALEEAPGGGPPAPRPPCRTCTPESFLTCAGGQRGMCVDWIGLDVRCAWARVCAVRTRSRVHTLRRDKRLGQPHPRPPPETGRGTGRSRSTSPRTRSTSRPTAAAHQTRPPRAATCARSRRRPRLRGHVYGGDFEVVRRLFGGCEEVIWRLLGGHKEEEVDHQRLQGRVSGGHRQLHWPARRIRVLSISTLATPVALHGKPARNRSLDHHCCHP